MGTGLEAHLPRPAGRLYSATLPAVFAAGHEGPVDTGDADAAAVRALGEHDEAVTIGAKPTAVGRVRIGGAHEDVFAGGIAIKFSQLRAIPRSFFVRHR